MHNHQNQSFAPERREPLHRVVQIFHQQRIFLRRGLCDLLPDIVERGRHDALSSECRNILVAQDGEHPGLEIGACLKLIGCRERADNGILYKIVDEIMTPTRTRAKARRCGKQPTNCL
jgi:hypothetical protein